MRLRRSISGAIALLAMATLSACNGHEEPHYLGYVEAEWTYVSAPAAGRIVEQPVREGDTVEAGTFLFRLDDTAEEAALAQANAQLDRATAEAENLETGARAPEIRQFQAQLREAEVRLAKAVSDRDRMLPLVEQGLAPETRADEVISAVEAAEASVEAARQQIIVASLPGRPATRSAADAAALSAEAARITAEYRLSERTVSAPAGGRIEEVFFRPGEYVVPGATVLAILPQSGLKARFFVPEAELPGLEVGGTVLVTSDGHAAPVEARISYISHEAEYAPPVIYSRSMREKLVFLIEADLPEDAGFHPGLPVEVDWQ